MAGAPDVGTLKFQVLTKIKELRLRQGRSQEDVARKAGLHLRSYQRIERAPQNLTLEALASIAHALRVDIVELLPTQKTVKRPQKDSFRSAEDALEYAIVILRAHQVGDAGKDK